MGLKLIPIFQKQAKQYILKHHRHHKPPVGSVFQIGIENNGELCGVLMAGRPVSRSLQDGRTLEVNRLCTNGLENACSMLYAAAWRAAKSMGYTRMITYILESEPGTSLKAAGWTYRETTSGGSWDTPSRRRIDKFPTVRKKRYEISIKFKNY